MKKIEFDTSKLIMLVDSGVYCIKSKYGCPYKQCSLHDYNYYHAFDDINNNPEYVETDCMRYLDE